MRFTVLLLSVGPLFAGACGCGQSDAKPTGTVSGRLTHNGEPLTDARITFRSPQSGAIGTAEVDSGGAFKIDGELPVGSYLVRIAPPESAPPPATIDAPAPAAAKDNPKIPAKLRDETTSGLTFEVKAGPNEFNHDVAK